MGGRKSQAFTEEFRLEAIRRSEQPGNTQASVGKELGISGQQIANWKRQLHRLSVTVHYKTSFTVADH